ncbi:enhancer of polycomb 1 isoform A [Chlorella sorokiniana]|uniref:Enhancer of polycomb-like protein n=1 Tax=Chlorella sorokiniana TaxID=3076 RepID=A0A2P6U1Z7_CHLSO|nr:enhancer of polycomb 1 isoform A [Chlorella sorokiniana]|eukprot:PRW60332.1 enhancer of polycomb 1 isoform A [Chlorella sorokiniana]
MSRSFRARPLDVNRQLELIVDIDLLDSAEGLPARPVVHNHAQLDADNEKPKMIEAAKPKMIEAAKAGMKEIPIPGVVHVRTYGTDYLPVRRERNTYIRPKGGVGYDDPILVEYDLDSEDEAWLAAYNGSEPERLSAEKFEMMLWRLEVTNAAATDRVLTISGAAPAERISAAACATTDHMPREEALQMLEETCSARDTIRADVYEYWRARRARLGRPLMRRLMAPTPVNDQNPYNVFRPRERIHRPQTRRRRENNQDSLEKLRMIRENVLKALDIFECLVKRERKKRDLVYVETDMQQLQIKQRHEPRPVHEQVEVDYSAAARAKNPKRPIGFDKLPDAAPATTNMLLDFKAKKNKKRKKFGEVPMLHAVSHLQPPPLGAQPGLPFAAQPSLEGLSLEDGGPLDGHARLPARQAPDGSWWQPRLGRGGRLVFDRCRPLDSFWAEPGTPEQGAAEADGAAAEDGSAAAGGGSKDKEGKGAAAGGKRDKEAAGKKDKEAAAAGDKDKGSGSEGGGSPAVKQEPQDGGQPAADGPAAPAADSGEGAATPPPAAAVGAAAPAVASWSWDKPLWEQPNPYAQWLNKSDLASAALTSLAGTPAAIAANPPTTVLKLRSPALGGGVASSAPGGSPAPGTASAATPGPAGGLAGTPATTAASRPAAGGAAVGTAGRPPLPPAATAAAGVQHKATPGTAGSARRDARRPAKAGQKSNLGPG